jgi:hypothetical protein
MVRSKDIQKALLGMVGFCQEPSADFSLSDELLQSDTGLYYEQVHPLITLQNLSAIAPDFSKMSIPEFQSGNRLVEGSYVKFGGLIYKVSKTHESDLEPDIDTERFKKVDLFSEWLEKKVRFSIMKAVSRFVNDKLQKRTMTSICENKTLFDSAGRLSDTIKNSNSFVGFEIVPLRGVGVTTKINKIGLQFTKPGDYKLYVFHSSSYTPVSVIEVTKKKEGFEWITLDDLYLPYSGANTDSGGSWYIGYLQSELPEGSKAIRKSKDWSKGPCSSCSRSEYISWQAWSRNIEIHPFRVSETVISKDNGEITMWDVENNQYTYDTNYGLNMEVSVMCDVTDFIIQQKQIFVDVIMKQFGVDMLREFAYNSDVRVNRRAINVGRMDILRELDGGENLDINKMSLCSQLEQAYSALEISTEGMSRACMPCRNNGVKYVTL